MRRYKCSIRAADAAFYRLSLVILAKKNHYMWASCCPRRGCTAPPTSRTGFELPEISAARRAHNARFEFLADIMLLKTYERPHAADGAVVHKLRRYQVTVY